MKARLVVPILAALLLAGLLVLHQGYYCWKIGKPESITLIYADSTGGHRLEKTLTGEECARVTALLRRATPTIFFSDAQIGAGHGLQDLTLILNDADGSSREFTVWCQHSLLYEGDYMHMDYRRMVGDFFYPAGHLPAEFRDFGSQFGNFRPKEKVEEPRRPLHEYLKESARPEPEPQGVGKPQAV